MYLICATKIFHFLVLILTLKVIQGQSDGAYRKPVGPTTKCSLGSNLVSVTVSRYFESKF